MPIALIVAMGENRVIGKDNQLPWHMPADLKHFRELTLHKKILMGRKTYTSIGKPLPHRTNMILTHDKNFTAPECIILHSLKEVLEHVNAEEEFMIIGGTQIFEMFLPLAQKIYLTLIRHNFEGDAYFPEYSSQEWKTVSCESHKADEKNLFDYDFLTLEKVVSV